MIGAKLKKDSQELVLWQIKKLDPIKEPSFFCFTWHLKDARRDPDNVCSYARKIILDALQVAEKLPNDNLKWVIGFTDEFIVDGNDMVEIRLIKKRGRSES